MTLDQLSAAATKARVIESRVDNRWQITLDFRDNEDAMRQFSDAYRTGQLVAVADDVKAALVRARDTAMHHTLAARIPECGTFGEIAQDLDAALAAMKDAQP